MAPTTVKATWTGPFVGIVGTPQNFVTVHPGETLEIPLDQAIASSHWYTDAVPELPAADTVLDLDTLASFKRGQLEQIVAVRGVTVEGTGQNGAVVKDDLVHAIFAAQHTDDQDDGGGS